MGKDLQGASSSFEKCANEDRAMSSETDQARLEACLKLYNGFMVGPEKEMKVNSRPKKPAYKGRKTIQVVAHSEEGLFSSPATIEDFVDKLTSTFLVGMTMKELVIINQWIESEFQNLSAAVVSMLHEIFYSRFLKRPVNKKIKDDIMESIGKVLDVYEDQLSEHKYLAGDSYTLADFSHLPLLSLVRTLDVFAGAFDKRPRVKAWVADITSTTAFLKTNKLD